MKTPNLKLLNLNQSSIKLLLIMLLITPCFSLFSQNTKTANYTLNITAKDVAINKKLIENNTLLFLNNNNGVWEIITGEAMGIPLSGQQQVILKLPNSLSGIYKIQLKNKNNDVFNYTVNSEKIKNQKFNSNFEWKEIILIDNDNQVVLTQSLAKIIN